MKINNFIQELKRRNVFRVATAYTIAGWIIIQVSDTVFPRLGLPEWTVTFIIAVVGIGFPIALIIAWAFELTPDGVHKSSEVDITESVTASTGKKLNGIIIASLGILVILLLSERIFFAESTIFETDAVNIENASIAVLPFVNMSADESNEYFSDGLSEELLNGLAKIEGMQVAARTSSFSFKGKNEDLRMVAEQLGVKHILEGSVRKDGDQIRITAQLIQADNGFHLWSETYDRELESIFAIQEEISRQVIQELKVRLLPEENVVLAFRPTEDIEAYNAFLEATQLESSRQPEDLEAAIVKYKQAINLDPSFALAHARLAKAYSHLFDYGDLAYESMIELMNDHINKALVINDQLGEAYLAKSMLESDMPNEDAPINTEIMARRADDLLPNNAEVINMIQIALRDQGKIDEADEYLLKAYRLDPLSSPITSNVAGMYRRDGEIEKALDLADKNISRDPDFAPIYITKLDILRMPPNSDLVEAFKFIHELHLRKPDDLAFMTAASLAARDLNMPEYSNYMISKMLELYPNNFDVFFPMFSTNSMLGKTPVNIQTMDQLRDRFGPSITRRSTNPYTLQYSVLKDFDSVLEIISKEFPEVSDGSVEFESGLNNMLNSDYGALTIRYATALISTGRGDDAEAMINNICSYYDVDSYTTKISERDEDQLNNAAICAALEGDKEEYLLNMNELFYGKNNKLGWPNYFITSSSFQLVKDDPDVQLFEKNVYSQIHEYRSEVISWLKGMGEWREEWEEQEN